ncbi:MAG: ferritin [Desulfobulbaceae bacterium]|nr:ferritin [Desulfobulbaceae bacterium]
MLNAKMEKALNEQVNWELYSSYFYLSMSSYFESISLPGCAAWMKAQAQEELFHAIKLYGFINERGGRAIMEAIGKPPSEWDSPLAVFEDVLAHEQKVTGLINDLVNLALDERDHASNIFLQWFVSEQVEEEASVGGVLDKFRLIGDDKGGLFAMDQELGQRVFTPPAK